MECNAKSKQSKFLCFHIFSSSAFSLFLFYLNSMTSFVLRINVESRKKNSHARQRKLLPEVGYFCKYNLNGNKYLRERFIFCIFLFLCALPCQLVSNTLLLNTAVYVVTLINRQRKCHTILISFSSNCDYLNLFQLRLRINDVCFALEIVHFK